MKNLNKNKILERWIANALGLEHYSTIMEDFKTFDIANDTKDFQKKFIYFYKVVFRKEKWLQKYFKFMQDSRGKKLEFEEVLRKISGNEGNIEVSFASKLLHTINPDKPIWDQNVLEKLHIDRSLNGETRDEKIKDAVNKYTKLEKKYKKILSERKIQDYIDFFDKLAPSYKDISEIKKVDFLFWSIRDKDTSKYYELDDDIFEDIM